jgi:hypothetical protein
VRGGIHAVTPDLARLSDGDVRHGVDLRTDRAALESRWLALVPSSGFAPLDIVRA